MGLDKTFIGYPSLPAKLGDTIEGAVKLLRGRGREVNTWKQLDTPGKFIVDKVLEALDEASFVVMDITRLNFNVTFETAYALAKRKRLVLTINRSLMGDLKALDELGLFDTIGWETYENADQLAELLDSVQEPSPIRLPEVAVDRAAPLFLLDTLHKTDASTRTRSTIKKTRIRYRSFDPAEQPRMSAFEAFQGVASSLGVVVHLIDADAKDHVNNNLRGAFLSGIAWALEKPLLLLQEGDGPVPVDYRDFVTVYRRPAEIDAHIASLAPQITQGLQAVEAPHFKPSVGLLASLSIGAVAAENEIATLGSYYVDTDEHRRAIDGNVQLAVGRKGSGKTALFFQVRDRIRRLKRNLVLDLKPDGHQLKRFKELLQSFIAESNREHAATAFWEYLILIEIAHKILDKDRLRHTRDHSMYDDYRRLIDASDLNPYLQEGDFSLRMLALVERIQEEYQRITAESAANKKLDAGIVTELIYREDIAKIRDAISEYLQHLESIWILVDNLDKGWPTQGVDDVDILMLRSIIDANRKIERIFRKKQDFETHSIVFLRNDVYELLVEKTPDRGKDARVSLDWTDRDLLLELLRRRLVKNKGFTTDETFQQAWRKVSVSHIGADDSGVWLLERSLMRPRYLLSLVELCRGNAVNLGHQKIEASDYVKAATTFSRDIAKEIGFELRDVMPEATDAIYGFIGAKSHLSREQIRAHLLEAEVDPSLHDRAIAMLLWFSFLGIQRPGTQEDIYIYDALYDMKKLQVLERRGADTVFAIHRAFWPFLDIDGAEGVAV